MEGGRLTFSFLCTGPPATVRRRDRAEKRTSGSGGRVAHERNVGRNIDEGSEKGKKEMEPRKEVGHEDEEEN